MKIQVILNLAGIISKISWELKTELKVEYQLLKVYVQEWWPGGVL